MRLRADTVRKLSFHAWMSPSDSVTVFFMQGQSTHAGMVAILAAASLG